MDAQKKNVDNKMRTASSHMREIQDQEKFRQANDLYEELGRELTALKVDLWLFNQRLTKMERADQYASVTEQLAATTRLIESTIQSVRKLSRDVKPLVIDQLGITAIIEWQLQEFKSRTAIAYTLTSSVGDLSLQRELGSMLIRVVQLMLANIESYGTATSIDVSIQKGDDSFLVLHVLDNGKGITERHIAASQSLGLLLMHERAKLLGGDLTINDIPARGTKFILRIPLSLEKKKLH